MGPDENLKEQRELCEWLLASHTDAVECARNAHRLAELARAMDEWLSRGSYLPEQWGRK